MIDSLRAEDVIESLRGALQRDGGVFHTVVEQDFAWPGVGSQRMWRVEAWLDLRQQRSREAFRLDPESWLELEEAWTSVANDAGAYMKSEAGGDVDEFPAPCPGITLVLADYFWPLCPEGPSDFTVSAERTEHEGAPAVALLFETRDDMEEPAESAFGYVLGARNRLLIDADTWLPLTFVSEADYVDGVPQLVRTATFSNELVPPASLPADFFDPAALGYVEPDPVGTLEASVVVRPVVWFGPELTLGEGRTLELRSVSLEVPGSGPGDRTSLEYEVAGGENGSGYVRLGVWTPESWEAMRDTPVGHLWWDSPCVQRTEVTLDEGRAVLFAGHAAAVPPPIRQPVPVAPGLDSPSPAPWQEPAPGSGSGAPGGATCPEEEPDRFMAHVYLSDVVVTINASDCLVCDPGLLPEGYRSVAGLESLARRLTHHR